jgi:hypothetical protein
MKKIIVIAGGNSLVTAQHRLVALSPANTKLPQTFAWYLQAFVSEIYDTVNRRRK